MKIALHSSISHWNEASQVFHCFGLFELVLPQNENPETSEIFKSLKNLNFLCQAHKNSAQNMPSWWFDGCELLQDWTAVNSCN